jgi:hypothetical protein
VSGPEIPDGDFERRLRDVLHARRLSINLDADALERIHAGAHRRQQRHRAAVTGGAALAVVALAAAGVVLRPSHHNAVVANGVDNATPIATLNRAATPTPSLDRGSTEQFSSPAVATTATSVPSATAISAGGAPPKGFVPMSVTAVNATTYWVLGHAPCGSGTCAAVAKTTDGGKSFTEVGAPSSAAGSDAPGNSDVYGPNIVSDIRFGDGQNGWAFGGGLWQTTDGGLTWSRVPTLDPTVQQSGVQRLAAANNRAWAIVLTGASSATGPEYGLYSTTYPGGTWSKVASAGSFGSAEPMLAVEGGTVVVIGTDATTGEQKAIVATKGSTTFTDLPRGLPCTYAAGDPLSATTNALWLACTSANGKLGGAYVSPDFGSTWRVASSKLTAAQVAIGAVDDKSAVVADGSQLKRVNADGSTEAVAGPKVTASTAWSFIGFTTTADGFAIPIADGSRQLWRTTDGGSHWSVVKF